MENVINMEKNKKWIVIPDVHGRKFWRDAVNGKEKEKIIFLGDYLDPYEQDGITSEDAYRELLDIIKFKRKHPDNVVLLLGNHDLGYLDSGICSLRRDNEMQRVYKKLFLDNLHLFDLIYEDNVAENKVLFSHAGIRTRWLRSNSWLLGNEEDFRPNLLNELLHNDRSRQNLFITLADSSSFRGGIDSAGSVVWADIEEFVYNNDELPGYIQIFGHSLHSGGAWTIENKLWCVDCAMGFEFNGDSSSGEINIPAA